MFAMSEITSGIKRLTMPLPVGPGHVHCYLLRGGEGWTLVDTGLGLPGHEELLGDRLSNLDAPVVRVVVTHFHPDHVGGAQPAAAVTGAPVHQGEIDYEQCEAVWGSGDWPLRIAAWFVRNGVPAQAAEELRLEDEAARPVIRFARSPERLHAGDRLDGWDVLHLPGHADGHLALLRDGVLVAGDHLLPDVTPAIGLYPDQRSDPLGDYLASLARTIDLTPRLVLPAHGEPIPDSASRAREIVDHHRRRLAETAAALGAEPRTGFDVSLDLFGADLPLRQRRFAVAETLSHLARLVAAGRARMSEDSGVITYTGREPVGRRPDS
jgi:glyoxylase-like metal-dependent hydrolase (beta-lactamase superfamily II)